MMKVILADEHPATRLGVRMLLGGVEGAEVVGEVARAEEVLRLVEKMRPDLVVLDPRLGGEMEGPEVLRRLKALPHPPRVLVYSGHSSEEEAVVTSLAGADGYLCKRVRGERFPDVVLKTCGGQGVWLMCPQEYGSAARLEVVAERAGLTRKEREVLALLAKRYTNREIADQLHLSPNTVKTHVRSVLKQLGLNNRQEISRVGSLLQT
ncbi:MAG: response regulator transcription factor [Actinomycetota bacterium]|nr:response regulator transcription factor [Actinomycetota bacterium]